MEIRQISLRSDTAANWLGIDPVLERSEFGVETDTGRVKIGDGATLWSALGYQRVDLAFSRDGTSATISATGDDAVIPVATSSLAGLLSAADKVKLDGITLIGDVTASADNTLTGANAFQNAAGQVFGAGSSIEDAMVIAGRSGGTGSYRCTLRPAALSANRELQAPDRNGVLITNADSGTVTAAMLAASVLNDGSY